MRQLALLSLSVLALSWPANGAGAQPASADSIRVALVQDDPQVELQIHGSFTMRALQTGEPIQRAEGLQRTRVRAVPEGLALGGAVVRGQGVRIEPTRDAIIAVNGTRLRGALEIVRRTNQRLLVVNHVALEDYLRGVLSKEAPDYWPPEALKAIAIAARTYAVYQRFLKADGEFDVTGNVLSQDYGGQTHEKDATDRAVKATEGLILVYQNTLFPPFYHSTCGGVTEHARVMGPYNLRPLAGGVLCRLCEGSPFYTWKRRITTADVAWALRKSQHGTVGTVQAVRITGRTSTGRVQSVTIVGSRGRLRLTGYDFRALFGFEWIRSLRFEITPVEGAFILQGGGWGHGVGMCQWGAAELARRGFSASEILAFYYRGAELTDLASLTQHPVHIVGGTS